MFIYIVLAMFLIMGSSTSAPCEDGWTKYGISCYKYFNQKVGWEEAKDHCKVNGAYLASVGHSGENAFVYSLIDKVDQPYAWVGSAADGSTDGTFCYANDNMIMFWPTDVQWGDMDGYLPNDFGFICEKKVCTWCPVLVYELNADVKFKACIDDVDGGGWLVFLRRFDGNIKFDRVWDEYIAGFPNEFDEKTEYWLGLDVLYAITSTSSVEMRVDITDFNGTTAYAKYSSFSVGPPTDKYRLSLAGYTGTAGDCLNYLRDHRFSTLDQDNDYQNWSCSKDYAGGAGWWYNNCYNALPTGKYFPASEAGKEHKGGVNWWCMNKDDRSYMEISMKIRPIV